MTPAEWQRCKEIFAEILHLPEDAREHRLEAACAGNDGLARAVRDLLASHARSGGFLDPPLVTRSMQSRLLLRAEPAMASETEWVEAVLGGRFRLRERIGSGAAGDVYRADDLLTGEQVACKVLRPGTGEDCIRGEIAALRLLRIPGVVRMIEEGVEDGRRYMVTELVEGAPFPGATLPAAWARIAETTAGLLETLSRIHQAGFVHRDLKPANVLVDAEGRCTVLDLGIALHPGRARRESGTIAGTPNYLSPEQLRGEPATPASDLFAVGVMLYEALAGRLPHGARTLDGLLRARQSAPPPLADCPPNVAQLVSQLLRPEPKDRPATAAEALALAGAGSARGGPDALPWLGSDDAVRAIVAAAERGQSIDIWGGPGAGRTRCLVEAAARLERGGKRVLAFRQGAALSELLDPAEAAAFGRLEEATDLARSRLADALRRGAVAIADDWEKLDPWVADVLSRCRDRGAVVRALLAPAEGAIRLRPFSQADLMLLFHGPDRVFHLREDAAAALHARSRGHPASVAEEVYAWVRAGHARWERGLLSVPREVLDRLTAIGPDRIPEVARADLRNVAPDLRSLAALVQIAGRQATPAGLAGAARRPAWQVDAQLIELHALGVLRYEDGVAATHVPVDVLAGLTQEELRTAHARFAEALPEGDPERLRHLIAARELGPVPGEVRILARRLADEGRLGPAISVLGEALAMLDAQGDVLPLLEDLMLLGFRAWSRGPLDRALYEIEMAEQRLPRARHLADLARAALGLIQGTWERSLVALERMEPIQDARLELSRQTLRVLASRRGGMARERAAITAVSGWVAACGIPEARRSLLVWLGWLRYREGRFAEAATLHGQAAALSEDRASRLSSMTSRFTALMDDHRLEEALAASKEALASIGSLRDPTAEARLLTNRRSLEYRLGNADAVDADLPDIVARTGVREIEAMACLTEAAVAWRGGQLAVARRLATRSSRAWSDVGAVHLAALPRALCIASSIAPDETEILGLAARAAQSPLPGIAAQAIGLLAIARPDLSPSLGIPEALLDALPRRTWDVRREVLSIEEALYRRIERNDRHGSPGGHRHVHGQATGDGLGSGHDAP